LNNSGGYLVLPKLNYFAEFLMMPAGYIDSAFHPIPTGLVGIRIVDAKLNVKVRRGSQELVSARDGHGGAFEWRCSLIAAMHSQGLYQTRLRSY
jgi:hypothetical protein